VATPCPSPSERFPSPPRLRLWLPAGTSVPYVPSVLPTVPARTSGGGRSRAATPFACGAGTLWRGHAHRRPSDFLPRLVCDCGCPPPARISGGGRSRAATPFACGAGTLWRGHAHRRPSDFLPRLVCDCGCPQALMSLPSFPPFGQPAMVRTPGTFPPKIHQKRRNITFYTLKHESTASKTSRLHAHPWAVGRVTPCAPLLASKQTSFPQPPPSQCFTLKKHIMQVPDFTTCYVRSQSAQDAGRVAIGFPLPSTGRGIEGEGWSYPEPPPVRFFLYQPHPGSRVLRNKLCKCLILQQVTPAASASPLASLSPPLRGGWRNPAPPIFGVCCGWSFGNGRAPPERLLDVVRVQAAGVAERHWILASYEVAGRVPKEVVRPGGTPEFRRPVRTDSVLQPTPGTW